MVQKLETSTYTFTASNESQMKTPIFKTLTYLTIVFFCSCSERTEENAFTKNDNYGFIENIFSYAYTTSNHHLIGNTTEAVINEPLVRKSIQDTKYINGEAVSIMVPESWQVSGQIIWNEANVALPAVTNLIAENKSSHVRFEAWPTLSFLQLQSSFVQPGQYYGGALVVSQLPDIATTLNQYLLPYFRKGIDYQMITNEDIRNKVPQLPADADARIVILEYQEDGVTVQEKILGMKTGYVQGGFASVYIITFACKTIKGEAEKYEPLFTQMFNSIQYSDGFNTAFKQISGYSYTSGMNSIAAAGKMSQQISANNDVMLQGMQQNRQYQNQQYYSNQNSNNGFGDYIRGQGDYYDPNNGQTYKLDYNYKQNWHDGNGTVIQSQDPYYNPNRNTNENWYELEPK